MKGLSGGLITDSAVIYAWMLSHENVLPIWGVQREAELDEFIREFDELRIGTLLSGEYDKNNAILKLNAGAGGTRAVTGAACCIVCIPAGRSARALPSKYWTIWMVTKQVSSQ